MGSALDSFNSVGKEFAPDKKREVELGDSCNTIASTPSMQRCSALTAANCYCLANGILCFVRYTR
jgi:hypothetical protein